MKYYKQNKFLKAISSTGIITVTACVLIAIGAIAWYALSRNNSVVEKSKTEEGQPSYVEPEESYNDIPPVNDAPTETTTDVNEPVDDVPYRQEEKNADPIEEQIKFILPIKGNVIKGYSDTALQYSATYGDMRLHTGIDIECAIGSEIKAVGDGTVKSIIEDANYGKIVVIDHTAELTVKYCGLKDIKVKEGDNVNAGDIIGSTGDIPCECADKPHIHIEATMQNQITSPLAALGLE
ncbi:MAG: M23 family metallopeptidase [Clostridia bacterium]|nr:M23 family metallopeptidase [Clostridia bacterium]